MECRKPGAAHPGGDTGRFHSGEGQGGGGDCGREYRSPASLHPIVIWFRNTKRVRTVMSTKNSYLAVFLGSKTGAKRTAWDALPPAERQSKEAEGRAAWGAWMQKHQAAVQ